MNMKCLLWVVAMLPVFGASAQENKSPAIAGLDNVLELTKQNVSPDENLRSAQNTAAEWTEITLPYSQNLAFIDGVSVNTWGGRAFYFKFTLAQTAIVGFTSNDWQPYFEIYKDEAMTEKLNLRTYPVLPAGVYYVVVSANETVTAQIMIQNLQPQSVTFPYDDSFSMTAATPQINGGVSLAYVFETVAAQLIDFTAEADNEVTVNLIDESGNLINVTNTTYLLGPGRHYVFVRNSLVINNGGTLSGNLKMAPNAYVISELPTLPFGSEFSLTQSNTVKCQGIAVQVFSFTLSQTRPAKVSWTLDENSAGAQFYFWDNNGVALKAGSASPIYSNSNLEAGKYFLMIADYSGAVSGNNKLSGSFKLEMLKTYYDWDYSEKLTPGHKIIGSNQTMSPTVVQKGSDAIMGRGFSFDVEAGKTYDLNWKAYISDAMASWMTGISTLKNELTGDYDIDRIKTYSGMYYNSDSGTGSLYYTADATGTIKGVFVYPKTTDPMPSDEIHFDLGIQETAITYTEPTSGNKELRWEDISLPFVTTLHFDSNLAGTGIYQPGYNPEIARGFKLALTEKTEVTYGYGLDPVNMNNPYLYIFKDEGLTECVSPNFSCQLNPENKVVLAPGTYYVIFSDGGFNAWSQKIMSAFTVLKGTTDFVEDKVVTIKELLNSDLPEISYTNDLAYSKSSYYVDGLSATVQGESNVFQWNGSRYYAVAYKLTGMNVGDAVSIAEYSTPRNEKIAVYKKAGDGTVSRIANDSDNGSTDWSPGGEWYTKTSLSFTADAATDYYVVVCPDNDKKYIPLNMAYNTIIWKEGEEPQPQTPQLPDEVKIASTQASASQITVPENATEEQIRQALVALGITGTNVLDETVNLKNNPSGWSISEDGASAAYTKLVMPYEVAANYAAAVVLINYTTGIQEVNIVKVNLAPNPAKDFVTVFGLEGGETVGIFDIAGRHIYTEKVKTANPQINIAGLQDGVYLVQISGNGKPQSAMLVVKK